MAGAPGWLPALPLLLLPLLPPALPRGAPGCAARGLCCPGRGPACLSAGRRPDGSAGPCYCDQACARALDCCHDYAQACPAIPCVVSQWSAWSGCAEPCKTTYRVRTRHITQEPRNGGEACPALEERAGCVEYWTRQGTECLQSLMPALITTGAFGKARKKRAAADGSDRAGREIITRKTFTDQILAPVTTCSTKSILSDREETIEEMWLSKYCVEFQLVALQGCLALPGLREGRTVCVECQPPALRPPRPRCRGDGAGSQQNQLLHWQAVGNHRCKGTWRRIRQLDTCSCPSAHSLLFI